MRTEDEEYDGEREVAEGIGKKVQTLRNWRCRDYGPPYVKIGNSVRYPRSRWKKWLADQIVVPGEKRSPA